MTSPHDNRTAFDLATFLSQREHSGAPDERRAVRARGGLSPDPQQPHSEDEVYAVMVGKGKIRVGEGVYPVAAGSVVFVETGFPTPSSAWSFWPSSPRPSTAGGVSGLCSEV